MINSILDLDAMGATGYGDTMEYALYIYSAFAASASDRLIEVLIATQQNRFKSALSAIKDVPWLRFKFALRTLGVDWESVQTSHYRDIFTIPLDNDYPLLDTSIYAVEHCSTEKAYADFCFKVPAYISPLVSGFHCQEHNNSCRQTLTIQCGMHVVPYGFLEQCAVKLIDQQIRLLCSKIRRIYSTREAFITWKEEAKSAYRFFTSRIMDEPQASQQNCIKGSIARRSAVAWYERVKNARENPTLICDYDLYLIENCVLPFWDDLLFLRYNQSLDRAHSRVTSTVHYSTAVYSSLSTSLPSDYSQLVEFALVHWSPCINGLLEKCNGSHLTYRARLIVVRFLLSPIVGYNIQQAAHLWQLFWVKSDVYDGDARFWDGEYGRVFTNLAKTDVESYKYWPQCKVVNKDLLCPIAVEHTGGGGVGDIEDAAELVSRKQQKCGQHMTEVLASRKRATKLRNAKIYSPNSYASCMHASYEL